MRFWGVFKKSRVFGLPSIFLASACFLTVLGCARPRDLEWVQGRYQDMIVPHVDFDEIPLGEALAKSVSMLVSSSRGTYRQYHVSG